MILSFIAFLILESTTKKSRPAVFNLLQTGIGKTSGERIYLDLTLSMK